MLALTIWLYVDFNVFNALLFLAWYIRQLGPYTLMLHNVSHRPFFKQEYGWLDWPFITILGMFFGHAPNTYFAHHVAMHHPENNLDDDLSTTMYLQRDSAKDFFFHYLASFMFRGNHDLGVYLSQRNRDRIRKRLRWGTAMWWAVAIGLAFVNWKATLLVFVATLLITRVAMMPGTAQAKLEIIGMIDCPDRPTERIVRSIRYAARARYPESSRTIMNRKRIRICGRKIITLPTPAIMPSAIRLTISNITAAAKCVVCLLGESLVGIKQTTSPPIMFLPRTQRNRSITSST